LQRNAQSVAVALPTRLVVVCWHQTRRQQLRRRSQRAIRARLCAPWVVSQRPALHASCGRRITSSWTSPKLACRLTPWSSGSARCAASAPWRPAAAMTQRPWPQTSNSSIAIRALRPSGRRPKQVGAAGTTRRDATWLHMTRSSSRGRCRRVPRRSAQRAQSLAVDMELQHSSLAWVLWVASSSSPPSCLRQQDVDFGTDMFTVELLSLLASCLSNERVRQVVFLLHQIS